MLALQASVLRCLNYIGISESPFYYPVNSTHKDLGRSGYSELYSLEKRFHGLILAKTFYNEGCILHCRLTNAIVSCKAMYTATMAFGWSLGL
jgi:hypothetical protein